jgi:hypothetical protein
MAGPNFHKNRINYSFCLGMLCLVIMGASCKVYTPQPAPVPLMSSKNELQLSGGLTAPAGITGSVAYSPVNHIAIEGHGFLGPQHSEYVQGMAGYYWENTQSLNFEIYAGIASGIGNAMKAAGSKSLKGEYDIYYTQFNFGQNRLGTSKIDYGFGIKAGFVTVKIIDNGYYDNNALDVNQYRNKYYLVEPIAFLRLGKNKLRTGVQINGVSMINAKNNQRQLPNHAMALGVSLNYIISKGK